MAKVALQFACHQVAGYDATGLAIHHYYFQHFVAGVHFYIAQRHLALEALVSAYQQLLAGLACCVKRALYLCATK